MLKCNCAKVLVYVSCATTGCNGSLQKWNKTRTNVRQIVVIVYRAEVPLLYHPPAGSRHFSVPNGGAKQTE